MAISSTGIQCSAGAPLRQHLIHTLNVSKDGEHVKARFAMRHHGVFVFYFTKEKKEGKKELTK